MGFFRKKNSDSRSRRNTRLWLLQARKYAVTLGLCTVVIGGGIGGYRVGIVKKGGAWLTSQSLTRTATAGFTVKDILVTGRHEISTEELLASLSIKRGMPLFGVDIAGAQKSLQGLPWVGAVTISRRLPDAIIVNLQERTPVALWQHDKKMFLIDKDGAVLTADHLEAWSQLPLVVGDGAQENVTQLLSLLQDEPAIAAMFTSAVRVENRRWDLHLKNNVVIKMPEQDIELALRRLGDLQEKDNILGRAISSVDLRQPEHVMITLVAGADTPKKTSL